MSEHAGQTLQHPGLIRAGKIEIKVCVQAELRCYTLKKKTFPTAYES